MELSAINLESLYASLKGIIEPPLQRPSEVEEEAIVLVVVKEACYWLAKSLGWSFKGEIPDDVKQGVIILAPHTSTLDFVFGMAVNRYLKNIRGRYLAKKELFTGPFRFLYELTGGIPVDRDKSSDLVSQVSKFFKEKSDFFLVLAPEGTRERTDKWKSGFYRIALDANVPIVMSYLDFDKKEAGVGGLIYPTGDFEADAKKIEAFYKNVSGKNNENWNWKVV